ncbi:toxin-antitoxin system HicB family antitoxin [Deinococcus sp.]|uniref:toxin-antitoxin system HicB family antitoxin n=1 Tax=Deinococcus sp. TaxID=47478 RepID=UPI0025EA0BD2|nr:toxin-antitoxin system HicB family antitoxin [Deinococcus sp.]
MTGVQLPDDLVRELMTYTGEATPQAAVMNVVNEFLRTHRADRAAFLAVLDKAPDVPPLPGDELP